MNKVAVVGGGLMGSGIATVLILSNYPVILKEVNEKFLLAGLDRIKGECEKLQWITFQNFIIAQEIYISAMYFHPSSEFAKSCQEREYDPEAAWRNSLSC